MGYFEHCKLWAIFGPKPRRVTSNIKGIGKSFLARRVDEIGEEKYTQAFLETIGCGLLKFFWG
jgi:hypothetical protein